MTSVLRKLTIAALCLGTLCVAVLSGHDAALQYWRREAMEGGATSSDVPAMFAHDPQIRVAMALVRFQNGTVGLGEAASLAADARAVLRTDPLSPAALYTLGMASEQADAGTGIGLLTLAERQSRRLVYTELALEGVLSARGDLAGAVARIDDIVTVAPDMAAPIFASIGPALPDPSLRAAFVAYAGRPWFGYLAKSAVENGVDIDTVLALLHAGQHSVSTEMKATVYASLIRRVVSQGDFDAARRLAGELPTRDRQTIGEIGFSPASVDPRLSVLGWSLFNDATTSATIDKAGDLAVTVGAEQSQAVATRTTLLAPGDYAFDQTVVHDTSAPRAGLTWDVACANAADIALWHQPLPDRGAPSESYRADITIPAGCNAQNWRLVALGATGQVPSMVSIGGLQLRRR